MPDLPDLPETPEMPETPNTCPTSPAAERNKSAILATLQTLLPASGRLLELAAGTGQHAVFCAAGLPGWQWQPSDPDPAALPAIAAGTAAHPSPGLLHALQLDVLVEPWPARLSHAGANWDALYCANMLHIAPWACCAALMRGAAGLLAEQGQLITYGPYRVQGEPTAPGNQAFDADLRARNPAWGLRWLHDIAEQAEAVGLQLSARHALPANNQILVFRRGATAT